MISLEQIIQSAAWSLFHSLWQIGIIGIILFTVLQMDWLRDPKQRFGLLLTGISLSVIAFLGTFAWYMFQYMPVVGASFGGLSFQELLSMKSTTEPMEAAPSILVKIEAWVFANMHYMVYAWLLGVGIFLIRFAGGLWYVNRLKTHKVSSAPAIANKYMEKWVRKFSILLKVRVLESAKVNAPLVAGIFKPVILFPIGMISSLHPSEVEAILAHEIAHILRSDMLTQTLCSLAKALLFYHPAMWWMQRILAEEREFACDAFALDLTDNPPALAQALANVKAWESNEVAMAFNNNQHYLLNRISRIFGMKNQTESNNYTGNMSALAIILAMLFLLPVAEGQNSPESIEKSSRVVSASLDEVTPEVLPTSIAVQPLEAVQKVNDTIPQTVNEELKKSATAMTKAMEKMEISQKRSLQEMQKSLEQAMKSVDMAKMINFDSMQINIEKALQSGMVDIQKALQSAAENVKKMNISEQEKQKMLVEMEQELAKQQAEIAKEITASKLELEKAKLQIMKDQEIMRGELERARAQMEVDFEEARINMQKEVEALRRQIEEERKKENNIVGFRYSEPLVVVDGVKVASMNEAGVLPKSIKEIKVLKGNAAVTLYGEDAERGVIEITTSHGNGPDPTILSQGVSVSLNQGTQGSLKFKGSLQSSDVLYVIDGKVTPGFVLKTMNASSIKSILVLKGESAIALYGEMAKDGVIEITTKGKAE